MGSAKFNVYDVRDMSVYYCRLVARPEFPVQGYVVIRKAPKVCVFVYDKTAVLPEACDWVSYTGILKLTRKHKKPKAKYWSDESGKGHRK